jgi:predicted enzyme related to lactoylglutathione lyase
MPTIVHFEIPTDNLQRARTFYGDLLGWKIEKYEDPNNPSSMEYWLITTTDEKGEKALMGGMMQREQPQQQILNYIDVPSIDEYASKVEKLGGKVVFPKSAVPTMGYFAVCLDTENNTFALWETDKNAK